jgi:hypothetical protein
MRRPYGPQNAALHRKIVEKMRGFIALEVAANNRPAEKVAEGLFSRFSAAGIPADLSRQLIREAIELPPVPRPTL